MGWLSLALGAAGLVSGAMSANTQAKAAQRAADTQAQAAVQSAQIQADTARQGIDLERSIYQDQRGLYAPQARLGAGALARMGVMAGLSPEEARSYYQGVDQAYSAPAPGTGRGAFSTAYDGYGDLTSEQRTAADAFLASRPDMQAEWQAALARGEQPFENDPAQFAAYYLSREPAAGATPAAAAPTSGTDPLEGYTATSWMTQDPGYAFRLSEGAKALERSAVAGGRAMSGAYDKALTRYGQDYASNEYQNAFNRLGVISGAGQTATGALSTAAQNYGQNAGGYMTAAGNAQAQGVANAGNARASGYQAAGNAWGDFWGNTAPGGFAMIGQGATDIWGGGASKSRKGFF